MKSLPGLIITLFCVSLLGGCATSRSELDIPLPAPSKTASPKDKVVYVNLAKDKRVFEVAPTTPSIPSLDPAEAQGEEIKSRAIGRKRNSFGKALGDLLLKEGQTVESLTTASIKQAFAEKGYTIAENMEGDIDIYVVDANIDKFWAWMNPGFFSITLSSEISTNFTILTPESNKKQSVSVKFADSYQTGMEEN